MCQKQNYKKCSLLMRRCCKVRSRQVNPFWGLPNVVALCDLPAEGIQRLNTSQIAAAMQSCCNINFSSVCCFIVLQFTQKTDPGISLFIFLSIRKLNDP
jgi:hypothetical protein